MRFWVVVCILKLGVSCDLLDSGDRGLWALKWRLKSKVVMQVCCRKRYALAAPLKVKAGKLKLDSFRCDQVLTSHR